MAETARNWDLYRTFLAVIREGNFSAASRMLGSTQPTVGRQIEALEAELGVSLFTRSPRGLVATPAANGLIPHAEAMASAAAALHRAASGAEGEDFGTVRVTMGEFMGLEVLPSILAEFGRKFPRIELELSLSNLNEDMLRRDADIAVRMMRPTQKELLARKIGTVAIGLFAHKKYVEAFGLPRSLSELSRHRAIGFDRDARPLQSSRASGAAPPRREDFAIRTDNVGAQMAGLRAGLGIAGSQVNVAKRDPDLVAVLPAEIRFEREIWLAMHASAKSTRRIRLLFDHLAVGLGEYVKGS